MDRPAAPPPDPTQEPEPSGGSRGPIAALIVVLVLVLAGWFLTQGLRKNAGIQDCVASGRTNCAPITPDR